MNSEANPKAIQATRLDLLRRAGEAYHQTRLSGVYADLDAAERAMRGAARALNEDIAVADLSNAKLQRAFFASFNGDGADFTDSDLTYAVCYFGSWVGAKFVRTNLTDATFAHANLRNADFRGATLKGADFPDADLTGAQFDHEQLAYLAERSRSGYGTPIAWPNGEPPVEETDSRAVDIAEVDTSPREPVAIAEETHGATKPEPRDVAPGENLSLF